MADEQSTRDRVRALVRDVLNNALPAEDEVATAPGSADVGPKSGPTTAGQAAVAPPTRFIQTAPITAADPVDEPEYTRDESSKMVITETDVHGLEEGARLRIAESARLTPLAADIV